MQAELFDQYVWKKQTYEQLTEAYDKSAPWLRQQIRAHEPPTQTLAPRPVVLTADAFYLRRGVGMMLFRSHKLRKNLLWFSVAYETTADYVKGVDQLERDGWVIRLLETNGGLFPSRTLLLI